MGASEILFLLPIKIKCLWAHLASSAPQTELIPSLAPGKSSLHFSAQALPVACGLGWSEAPN